MINQTKSPYSTEDDHKLCVRLWDPNLKDDLAKFVQYSYPWGRPGTPLENQQGPRSWQREELNQISEFIAMNRERIRRGDIPLVYRSSTVSGRGVGKSCLVAWLTHWMMSTVLGSSTIVTANTEDQLKSKTWPEVGKWLTLSINGHWFEVNALTVRISPWMEKLLVKDFSLDCKYYQAGAKTWSEDNPDAFAGQHNMQGTLLVFDEASGIPKPIWTTADGYFTEPVLHRYQFAFSNGRRNTGPFFECFHKFRNYWHRRHIDARTVEGTDKAIYDEIIAKYGEDSDEARVEVKGQFPRQGDKQFISREIVTLAKERDLEKDPHAALIMGIDIARFGDDKTVFRWRQGRDARSIKPIEIKSMDNMEVAVAAAHWIDLTKPDAVCIDAGNGTGVIDRLRDLGYKVHEIWFSGESTDKEFYNKRTQMWGNMRDWLKGGMIDVNEDLETDLTAPEYKFMGAEDTKLLESKESLKKRGFASPDHADALCLTFAVKVARKDNKIARHRTGRGRTRIAKDVDYPLTG